MAARSCDQIVLSNNNPHIDILDYVHPAPGVLTILQQKERWEPVKRFCIAREMQSQFYACIDDDLFLTSDQIDSMVEGVAADPGVPHGVWGERIQH